MPNTPNLQIPHLEIGQTQKETTANEAFDALDGAIAGVLVFDFVTDADYTLDVAFGVEEERNMYLRISDTGTVLTTGRAIILPQQTQLHIIENQTAQILTIKTSVSTSTAEVGPGVFAIVFCDGVNVLPSALSTTGSVTSAFVDLSDTPGSFAGGDALKVVRVNAGETALEFVALTLGSTDFVGLTDTPGAIAGGDGLKVVRVNTGETALEFVALALSDLSGVNFLTLDDTPASFAGGDALKVVRVNAGESALEFYTLPASSADFVGLTDTPGSIGAGDALKVVRVNAGETALEFVALTLGAEDFVGLTDTPGSIAGGDALKLVRVNAGETALEFYALVVDFADLTGSLAWTDLSDTPGALSAAQGVRVNAGATALELHDQPYDVGGTFTGVPGASVVMLRFPLPRKVEFPSGLTDSQGVAGTSATAQTDFDIQKGGSSVGTMRFAAAATTATFIMASATTFNAGDVLTVVAPGTPDATLADVGFALAAVQKL